MNFNYRLIKSIKSIEMKSTKYLSKIQFNSWKLVKVLTFIAVIMLYLLPLNATTYYVSLSGDDENSGTSTGSAWRHIAYGTQQVQAGDTLLILSGDYGDERAEIANSGSPGSPIVIMAETPGDVVMESSTGGGTGILIEGNSHIVIEGIEFRNFGGGIQVYHVGSYITVRKCVFVENHNNGFTTWGTSSDVSQVHHILVEYCEFYDFANGDTNDNSQDYGIYFCYASHCVAKNNYFFGWHHQALSFKRKVHYGLAKDNVFEGFRYSALYLGQNLDDPNDQRSRYLIAEGNTFSPAEGYRAKTPIWIANVDRAVVRNNFMEGHKDTDGGSGQGIAIGDPAYSDDTRTANPTRVNIYNNVIRTMGGNSANPGIRVIHVCNDVRVFNNTFTECAYGLGFETEDTVLFENNLFYDSGNGMIKTGEGTGENSIFRYNNIYPYWSGSSSTDISDEPLLAGTLDVLSLPVENPRFIPDYSRAEVCQLQETSPCIDAGTDPTVTTASGSGTVIGVEDAGYFTDGFGLSYGDLIQVGGNNPVRITGIDYDNNEITVAQSISWNSGDGVNFFYVGSTPDIGAYEYVITGTIAGTVTDNSTSNPIEGVRVSDGTRYDSTDANGNYTLEDVPVNHTYTVTASKSGYTSSSSNDVVVTEGNTTTEDFVLTKIPVGTISGTVTDSITGDPMKGAMVTDGTRADATDAGGNYSLTDVPEGLYTVTASFAEYIPKSFVDNVTENSTLVLDFPLVVIPTGTISGTVTDNTTGDPIEGVIVSNGIRTDTTDAGGNYTLLKVYADSVYTVTASKSGYLALSVDDVVVTEGNTTTVDFVLTEASDLVCFWSMEETAGTIAYDSSVNLNHGDIYGPISTAGKKELAFQFDGTDDYITVPKSASIDGIVESITLIAWVKIPATSRHTILSRWDYASGDERSFEFDVEDGTVWFGLSGDGSDGTFLNSGSSITPDTWTHVAATSDGTTMKIYINGILDPETKNAPSSIYPSAADIQIGRWLTGDWYYPFNGSMDEVKIFNRALSVQEISDDFSITEPTGAVSGTVTDNRTGDPLQGAIVTDGTRSDTTDAGGNYTIETIPLNISTVTASISGYHPLSINDVVVTEDQTTTVDFQLSEKLYGAISGTVTDLNTGVAIQDVIVTDGTRSDVTDAGGNYILEIVPQDTYTVAASVSGYLISTIDDVFATGNDTTIVDFFLTRAPDLVGFWPFEETTGTVTADLSTYSNEGELYGPTSTSGIKNLAFQFNGTTDYIRLPKSASLDSITNEISIISWVKMPVDTRQTIIERWLMNDHSFILDVDDAGKVNFGLCGDGTFANQVWLTSAGSVTADTWTHVAVTSNGTTMKVYIDSVLDANTIAPPLAIYTADGNVHIGRWAKMSGFWSNPFNGIMDELKLYNSALTAQEIAEDFITVGINKSFVDDVWLQAYPNPFNSSITISYKLAVAGKVNISIYNLSGQKLRTLVSETQQADYQSVVWDGTNATGEFAGSGIYFCTFIIDDKPVATQKLMMLK